MDEEMNDVIVVQSFFDDGFILNNGAHIHGPILLFPNLIFNVRMAILVYHWKLIHLFCSGK